MASLQSLVSFIRRKVLRNARDRWNHKYEQGRWESLKEPAQNERFYKVGNFIKQYTPGGNLLEIGCGEALLQQKIDASLYSHFTGIDVSDVAIERAKAYGTAKTVYEVADMETYVPAHSIDAIIFTESVYYSKNSVKLLQRLGQYLKPQGIFIISIYDYKHSAEIWQKIEGVCRVVDQVSTTNHLGTWQCKVLAPISA